MPLLHNLGHSKARILMYADDHVPAHIHVKCPDFKALINIETLEVMRGTLPIDVLKDAKEWVIENRELLRVKWRELNERDN
jgi:hypothetical protein